MARKKEDSKADDSLLDADKSDTTTRRDEATENNKKRLLSALEKTKGLVYKACKAARVHPSTYYDYLDKDEDFADAVDIILNNQIDEVEGGLLSMIQSDKPGIRLAATDIYLKAKAKNRGYGTEKRQQELSGEIKQISTVEVTVFEMPNNGTYEGQRSPIPEILDSIVD